MAKTWVLDTETKGTGAHIAPLKDGRPNAERERSVVDARISVWAPSAERWRLLSVAEQRALWRMRWN